MIVRVNKAWTYSETGTVNLISVRRSFNVAHGRDAVITDQEITVKSRCSSSVDDCSFFSNVFTLSPLLRTYGETAECTPRRLKQDTCDKESVRLAEQLFLRH